MFPHNQKEKRLPDGIVLGHAYTVTKVYQVRLHKFKSQRASDNVIRSQE